ncbi:UDP-galactose transporter [Wallemia mellicola CBS 633.66]|uniref:GDP-mannose transporter n=1 Tax=Wallemia mellicola (strain ATCC MYA-4683 / CBS 633.66) TaxID=671144 RepID=I4YDR4_WALMC|nr:UDP-galactose transporter [Wallemia mellicola CBS 633.66]EIM22106.1 UDP-galactose transporter [Wallemia mellicola CBS 633.66]|eukprot:XP_006957908.1 UDP-galactose transporter [Wallemia mellicola CBS 633.66]
MNKISINGPLLSIISYCFASISMTIINKYIVSGEHFNMNLLLLSIQSIVCILTVYILKLSGFINYKDFNLVDIKNWFPVSFSLVLVIYTGSKALQFLSIPIYTIFKNLTIILIAYGELLWFNNKITRLTSFAFLLMVLSSVVAAYDDFDLNDLFNKSMIGYFWMALNCLSSAAYVLLMRKRIKLTGFKDWDSMAFNNALSIPLLIVSSLIIEDWSFDSLEKNFPPSNRYLLLSTIAFSGAAAVGISYTTAWCVRTTSSTTYSMVGALNKLPVAASGLIFFNDPATVKSVSAIILGFIAGIIYAIAKQKQSKSNIESKESIIPLNIKQQK